MIQANTSKSALSLNVNNARRDLLYQLRLFLKVKTFVVCTAILNIKREKIDYSLTKLRKRLNGEHTKRKICSHKIKNNTRKLVFMANQLKDTLVCLDLTKMLPFSVALKEVHNAKI